MQFSLFTDYGVTTLAHLGERPDRRASVPEIAQRYGLSIHHLGKVVNVLGKSGLLRTIRGNGGGLELSRAPDQISLGEVVRVLGDGRMVIPDSSPMRVPTQAAAEAFIDALDRYTIKDLIAREAA